MRLGVNVDHVATVRQARRGAWPDPVEAARKCEAAGADSIVCHLREDRRHIQDRDVRRLVEAVRHVNLEMSIAPDVVRTALAARPAEVTLVPERRQELTTEGGLDAARLRRRLVPLVRAFETRGIAVSLFIDPLERQIDAARASGAGIVELHTGGYAEAHAGRGRSRALAVIAQAARVAQAAGLRVAAGHGLDYGTVGAIAAMPEIEELNIGFAIISRALFAGMERAVTEMREAMRQGRALALPASAARVAHASSTA